jgi:EAL domain-containing protein (putative c-di-GMP-specific phosphodiesterase class I)
LRWVHPERGSVRPDHFIPIAEACGAIIPIGAWVLRQACAEAVNWEAPLRIAVNVSPAQFLHGDFAALVEDTLAATGLPPTRLELEVTEGLLINDPARTLAALQRIRATGVSISMDDFGTGYSSLSSLRAFPFDRIKIDRSFVKDLTSSSDAAAIVAAVLGLAHGLGLPVVAEGIEDAEQLAALRTAHCAEGQGYLIGKPGPIAAFAGVTNPGSTRQAFAAAAAE